MKPPTRSPLESSRDLAERLEQGVLLIVEHNAHTAYQPKRNGVAWFNTKCVTTTNGHYLIDLQLPTNMSVCQHEDSQLQPPD